MVPRRALNESELKECAACCVCSHGLLCRVLCVHVQVAVSDGEHYAHRGVTLLGLTPVEFAQGVALRRATDEEQAKWFRQARQDYLGSWRPIMADFLAGNAAKNQAGSGDDEGAGDGAVEGEGDSADDEGAGDGDDEGAGDGDDEGAGDGDDEGAGDDTLAADKPAPGRGRKRLLRMILHVTHPLFRCHYMVQKAKWGVPSYAGDKPPAKPKLDAGDTVLPTTSQQKKFDMYGAYYMAVFSRWHALLAPTLSYQALLAYKMELRREAYGVGQDDDAEVFVTHCDDLSPDGVAIREVFETPQSALWKQSPDLARERAIAHGRLCSMDGLENGFKTHRLAALLTVKARARSRTLWKHNGSEGKPASAAEMTDEERQEAAKHLAAIRAKAESKNAGADLCARLRQATSAEKMGKGLIAQLPSSRFAHCLAPAPGAAAAPSDGMRLAWAAAAAPSRRTEVAASLFTPEAVAQVAKANKEPMPPLEQAFAEDANARETGGADAPLVLPERWAVCSDEEYDSQYARWRQQKDIDDAHPDRPSLAGKPPLNPEQREECRQAFSTIHCSATCTRREASVQAKMAELERRGLHQIIMPHGAGGTGKSAVVHEIVGEMRAHQFGILLVTAYTGVAAAPFNGPTLLSLCNMGIASKHAKTLPRFSATQREALLKKFELEAGFPIEKLEALCIDEISFLDDALFGHVDHRFRVMTGNHDVYLGGIPLLLSGDNFQKPPPQSTPWFKTMVWSATPNSETANQMVLKPDGPAARGLALLQSAYRIELVRIMRAVGDPGFVQMQMDMRRTGVRHPIPRALVEGPDRLRAVSEEDIRSNERFLFAPVGGLSHVERDYINWAQAVAFAKYWDVPLLLWRLEPTKPFPPHVQLVLAQLYDEEPALYGIFVEGAPCQIEQPIRSTRGMVNGSKGLLDSLSWQGGIEDPAYAAARREPGGVRCFKIIKLTQPPHSVNVRLSGGTWHGVELPDLRGRANSLVDGEVIVPLLLSNDPIDVDLHSIFAAQIGLEGSVQCKFHNFRLSFCLTDYKLQGVTLPLIIINVYERLVQPFMDFEVRPRGSNEPGCTRRCHLSSSPPCGRSPVAPTAGLLRPHLACHRARRRPVARRSS